MLHSSAGKAMIIMLLFFQQNGELGRVRYLLNVICFLPMLKVYLLTILGGDNSKMVYPRLCLPEQRIPNITWSFLEDTGAWPWEWRLLYAVFTFLFFSIHGLSAAGSIWAGCKQIPAPLITKPLFLNLFERFYFTEKPNKYTCWELCAW